MAAPLPYSLEAEKACLGAIILKNSLYQEVFPFLKFSDFHDGRHQMIIKGIDSFLSEQGNATFDVLTISEEIKKKDELKKIGGIDYLNELIDSVPTTSNIQYYRNIVREKSVLRQVIDISENAVDKAKQNEDSKELLAELLQEYFELSGEEYSEYEHLKFPFKTAVEEMVDGFKNKGAYSVGILSGFQELDKVILGLRESNLIILAGSTGMGKTAFALNMVERIGLGELLPNYIVNGKQVAQRHKVGFFSLEMSKKELCMRILSTQSRIDLSDLQTLKFDGTKWPNIIKVADAIAKSNIYIDDTSGMLLPELVTKAKKMVNDGVEIIFVDYLQLIRTPDASRIPREQQVSEISKGLKNLARELKIPVVALSQLSRSANSREDKTPRLSDIRESGAIEQDADLVLFIGPGRKAKEEDNVDDFLQTGNTQSFSKDRSLSVAKNRHGPTKDHISLKYEGRYLRFDDYLDEA